MVPGHEKGPPRGGPFILPKWKDYFFSSREAWAAATMAMGTR
jgi:hypothetical protein